MKKFLSGVLCATLVFSLALSTLAISGRMTIEVDPINVQVNGEVFQPTDVTGKEVPVFAYQGTTYAPLRALAEAYGLEVGYDAATNMATVTDPDAKPVTPTPDPTAKTDYSDWSEEDEAAYQEFKGIFVSIYPDPEEDGVWFCGALSVPGGNIDDLVKYAEDRGFMQRFISDISNGNKVTMIDFFDGSCGLMKPYSVD